MDTNSGAVNAIYAAGDGGARGVAALSAEAYGGAAPESPESFGRRGSLEVRLATTPQEIDAAQALRYRVFYEEMSATPDAATRASRRDIDRFDDFCDHLLVIDHALAGADAGTAQEGSGRPMPSKVAPEAVIGCYRLLRQEVAEAHGGFYTAGEFDIGPMLRRAGPQLKFLELGRSCVLAPYRTRPTVELLWHGIMHYVAKYNLDVMFGCASFEGIDPGAIAMPLAYLHHFHGGPADWHVRALPERYVEMNRIAKDAINLRDALRSLPPVIKGYIRAGCYIGDGAVIDEQFGTIDVLILFPITQINARYRSKFSKS